MFNADFDANKLDRLIDLVNFTLDSKYAKYTYEDLSFDVHDWSQVVFKENVEDILLPYDVIKISDSDFNMKVEEFVELPFAFKLKKRVKLKTTYYLIDIENKKFSILGDYNNIVEAVQYNGLLLHDDDATINSVILSENDMKYISDLYQERFNY